MTQSELDQAERRAYRELARAAQKLRAIQNKKASGKSGQDLKKPVRQVADA